MKNKYKENIEIDTKKNKVKSLISAFKTKFMKRRKKTDKEKIENIYFNIICLIGFIFFIIPILLRCSFISDLFSWFLYPLRTSEYKSSYSEILGSILGTFLAIFGAVWTQKKADAKVEEKNLKESALIVYYDIYFAITDIQLLMSTYLQSQGKIIDVIEDMELFMKYKKNIRFYLDDNWIRNVASLSQMLSNDESKMIYKIYGDLNTIKQVFNNSEGNISNDEVNIAYKIMLYEFCKTGGVLREPFIPEVKIKDDINNILEKLKSIAKID